MRVKWREASLANVKLLVLFSEGWGLLEIWINVTSSRFYTLAICYKTAGSDRGIKYSRNLRNLQYPLFIDEHH